MQQSSQSHAAVTEVPQEVREAAKWRHGPTCGSHAFADRSCTCGAEADFHAMFLAGKRAGMEELPDEIDLFRIIRAAGRSDAAKAKALTHAIRSEANG